jgi:diacylglycerol kinase family enzyme
VRWVREAALLQGKTSVWLSFRSKEKFDTAVKPMLAAAGLHVTVYYTQRQAHATEITASLDLSQCDALALVGGDGTVYEALQARDRAV